MEKQCTRNLSKKQQEQFSLYANRLSALSGNYAEFCYRRGAQDCIALLKRLRIL